MPLPSSPNPNPQARKMGLTMFILAWLVLFALLAWFFGDWLNQQQNPNQQPLSTAAGDGSTEVTLLPNRQHHYLVSGLINGKKVVFLLDTGATDVVIPQQLARTLQLPRGQRQYASTANGVITVHATQIDDIQIGNIHLRNIRASINPGMDNGVILLGMSALRQIEFRQQGDRLILKQ